VELGLILLVWSMAKESIMSNCFSMSCREKRRTSESYCYWRHEHHALVLHNTSKIKLEQLLEEDERDGES
jgi:hypothetical protein